MASKFLHNQSSTPRSKKWVILPIIAILILASGGSFMYFKNKYNASKNLRDSAQVESAKEKLSDDSNKVSIDINSEKATGDISNQTTEQTPISQDFAIALASQSQSEGLVKVSAKATGATEGRCVFSFTTEGDRPVVRESTLSNGICSAEIPEVEFSRLGVWNLNISLHVNNTRTEVNQSVTIN
jgi:hypothetical protein